jgi:hypothetical protein
MSSLTDEVHEWQSDVAIELYRIVNPEDAREPLAEVDEVCFFGALASLPEGFAHLKGIASVTDLPEVYIVALKDGELVPPEIWFVPPVEDGLRKSGFSLQEKMKELQGRYIAHGQDYPAVVKTAVVMEDGQAITIQEFDRLPDSPHSSMSAADWAFDQWVERITHYGSAFVELND